MDGAPQSYLGPTVLVLGLISILVSLQASRTGSPVLAIFSRWARWAFLGCVIGAVFEAAGVNREPHILIIMGLLTWMLLETAYNWFVINAISRSEMPLFPKFVENHEGDDWPSSGRFIALREWLRKEGFKKIAALKAELDNQFGIRTTVFEHPDRTTRLQVMFLPSKAGSFTECFVLASETESGIRIITDNFFLPYGGFYPDTWYLERKPWTRSLQKLFQRHQARLAKVEESLVPWETDPLDEINRQQRLLEMKNQERGFLVPFNEREEHGRLTWEGRYRVWKEWWMLSYLGIPTSRQ